MSENVKPLADQLSSPPSGSSDQLSLDTSLMQAAEARMRRALGLEGGAAKPRPQERQEPQQRQMERFVAGHNGHNGHKRRFVQDGEVPVTVVSSRRDGMAEMAPHRGPTVGAASNRLEAAEQALAHEIALRQQVERTLTESQATVHDLQTKLGHAELARVEAVDRLRREQEAAAALRTELQELQDRLHTAESARPAPARRGRPPRQAATVLPVVDDIDDIDDVDDADDNAEAFVAPAPQTTRRGRPPGSGRKAAPKSKLVRWWIKDDAKPG